MLGIGFQYETFSTETMSTETMHESLLFSFTKGISGIAAYVNLYIHMNIHI